jgi:type IV secretion system protein TrbJ
MRRPLTALLVAWSISVPYSRAQFLPFGFGGATEITQLLNHGQLVMAYARQAQQLEQEIKMYLAMLRNLQTLPEQYFAPIAADINALASVVQGGRALAYSLGNLDSLFRSTFPGYGVPNAPYYTQYKIWSRTSLDTTLGSLKAAGLQGQQLQNEQAVLSWLRSQAQSSDGAMKALQIIGSISEQEVQQLMKLRQLMLADMTSKQAFQATMLQQQATSEAAAEQFFDFTPVPDSGHKRY